MPPEIAIVPTRSRADLELVHGMWRAMFDEIGNSLPAQFIGSESTPATASYQPPQEQILVALADGRVAGAVGLRSDDAQTAELVHLFVVPLHRGLGIATALVSEAVHHAGRMGYERVVTHTHPALPYAILVLERVGFARVRSKIPPAVDGALHYAIRPTRTP